MRWVRDGTGRFRWRPFLEGGEIDILCERRVERFLRERYATVSYPLSTDDLTRLIEQDAGDLDLLADLSTLEGDSSVVEGVTTFMPGRRPSIQIARQLSEDTQHETRLRTTLAHELGHVLLHDFTGDREDTPWPRQADDPEAAAPILCTPGVIGVTARVDWMEWQASYACGALLMPWSALRRAAQVVSSDDVNLIERVQHQFWVSEAAARVRLRQQGYLPRYDSPVVPRRGGRT